MNALVTGVGRRVGIGYAIVKRLEEQGTTVFTQAWTPHDAAQPWGADEGAVPPGARHTELDLTEPNAPEQLVASIPDHLDVLVINHAHSSDRALGELDAEEIDRSLAVNVRAPLLLVQAFHAQHDGREGGRVILMTSGQHRGPMPGLAYIAGKGAQHQLTLSLASAVADKRITVNTVDPGATDTGYATPKTHASVLAEEPFGRWGEPDDAARLIAFLCSEDGRWITGQVITSSGGGP